MLTPGGCAGKGSSPCLNDAPTAAALGGVLADIRHLPAGVLASVPGVGVAAALAVDAGVDLLASFDGVNERERSLLPVVFRIHDFSLW